MACLDTRSHGGDAGGDPPPPSRRMPSQCEGSGQRGPTRNKQLKKAVKKNKNKPLELQFEYKDQKTFKAVGDHAHHLYNYIGELLRDFPCNYDTWEKLPNVHKTVLIPAIKGYFNLQPCLDDETIIKIGSDVRTVGSLVGAGLESSFKKQWKDRKNKLKTEGFSSFDSIQEAREAPAPGDWKRSREEWEQHIDFWADPKRMATAKKNAENRAKNKTPTYQGSKSFAQGRHEYMQTRGEGEVYQDLISHWKDTHSKDGVFEYKESETFYNQMIAMQQQVNDQVIPPLTNEEIIDTVIGSNDRGHNAGRGRNVPGIGSSHHTRSSQDYMTRETWSAEREVLIQRAQKAEDLAKEARNEASSVKNMFTQFMAHFNSQAGSSSSLTPFIPCPPNSSPPNSSPPISSPPISSPPISSPPTDRHHSLADVNPDPNLYQHMMNPGGCYRPVMGDEESGDDE